MCHINWCFTYLLTYLQAGRPSCHLTNSDKAVEYYHKNTFELNAKISETKHYFSSEACSKSPRIEKLFASFNRWSIADGCDHIHRHSWADMTTAGAVLTKTAHVLHQPTPPVTFTDLAKSRVDATVWNTSDSCRRTTWSRAGDIGVSRSKDLLLFGVIINDKLSFVLPPTVIEPLHSCFVWNQRTVKERCCNQINAKTTPQLTQLNISFICPVNFPSPPLLGLRTSFRQSLTFLVLPDTIPSRYHTSTVYFHWPPSISSVNFHTTFNARLAPCNISKMSQQCDDLLCIGAASYLQQLTAQTHNNAHNRSIHLLLLSQATSASIKVFCTTLSTPCINKNSRSNSCKQ